MFVRMFIRTFFYFELLFSYSPLENSGTKHLSKHFIREHWPSGIWKGAVCSDTCQPQKYFIYTVGPVTDTNHAISKHEKHKCSTSHFSLSTDRLLTFLNLLKHEWNILKSWCRANTYLNWFIYTTPLLKVQVDFKTNFCQ